MCGVQFGVFKMSLRDPKQLICPAEGGPNPECSLGMVDRFLVSCLVYLFRREHDGLGRSGRRPIARVCVCVWGLAWLGHIETPRTFFPPPKKQRKIGPVNIWAPVSQMATRLRWGGTIITFQTFRGRKANYVGFNNIGRIISEQW